MKLRRKKRHSWSVLKLHLQSLYCKFVKDGVPKGSVLEHLHFLIDINDLPQGQNPDINIFQIMVIHCFQTCPLKLNSDPGAFAKLYFF